MPKIDTALSQMLGIDYPIIMAPMFLVKYFIKTLSANHAVGKLLLRGQSLWQGTVSKQRVDLG